jgi:hypothetical protein
MGLLLLGRTERWHFGVGERGEGGPSGLAQFAVRAFGVFEDQSSTLIPGAARV